MSASASGIVIEKWHVSKLVPVYELFGTYRRLFPDWKRAASREKPYHCVLMQRVLPVSLSPTRTLSASGTASGNWSESEKWRRDVACWVLCLFSRMPWETVSFFP